MQPKRMQILFAVVVLACAMGVSHAIKCYECTSLLDGEGCADPFGSSKENPNCGTCMKAKYKMNGNQVVARSCVPVSAGKDDCESGDYQGVSADLCYCDSDLCNTSSHVTVSMVTSLGAGALVLILKKLF